MSCFVDMSLDENPDVLAGLLSEHLACAHALDSRRGAPDLVENAARIKLAIAKHFCVVVDNDDSTQTPDIGTSLLDAARFAAMAATMTNNSSLLEAWGIGSSDGNSFASATTSQSDEMTNVQNLLRAQHQSPPVQLGPKALRAAMKQLPLRQ